MTDLNVLGPVEAAGDTGVIDIGGPRQRRLLTALVVDANTVISTERLIDVLWDGEPPDGARRSFKTYVARLRSALAQDGVDGLVVTHPLGYAVEIERDRIDATRFEQLVEQARAELALGEAETALSLVGEALALWRGPAFGEFAAEEWVQAAAARLEETRIAALELRIEAQLATGRHQELQPEIEALIRQFPYRDSLRSLQMRALYRSGRQVDALREFQDHRRRLADEVGVDPGAELVELEQRIIAQDPDLLKATPSTRSLRNYELGPRIGPSRHAVIYRGRQPSIGRDVAIKVIRPDLANDPEFIQRFEAEAQLVASIEHPHVVPLYDFWREPGGAYLVMRWLDGGSLADRISGGEPLGVDEAIRLIEQIGGALTVAHRAGVVHRDIRAASIVHDDSGNAYLTDFAIAEHSADGPDRSSVRSDVHDLGAVLHEALCGTAPSGPSEEWDPAPIRADVPEPLDAVIRRACAADPADRFRDMAAFVVSARAAAGSGPIGLLAEPGALDGAREAYLAEELERINPYKGLRPFGEGDSADFHGRSELTERLVQAIRDEKFVAVVGPSGSGKSSLVRAGVVPRFRADGFYVATMVPGTRQFDELEQALRPVASREDPTLRARLSASADGISESVRSLLPLGSRLLLVIDQFEELFTTSAPDEREQFLDAITVMVGQLSSPVHVVVTLRADFYDRPLQHPGIGALVRDRTTAITPLTADQLEAAVIRPAARVGVAFEPALVAALVTDAAAEPGMLPLLQYALTELFANRTGDVIGVGEYQELGRISGILAVRAEAIFADLGDVQHHAVARLFTALVTPGEGAEDTRRRALVGELGGVPEVVIDTYAKARLITFDHDPVTREPTVEVAHEALIRAWPRLREWVDADRDALRALAHLSTSARTWDERGRDPDELYRGARLAAAAELSETDSDRLGPLAAEFLDESTTAADAETRRMRRTTRRLRGLLAAAGVLLVLALAAGALAVSQSREASRRADEAELNSLVLGSSAEITSDHQLAVLLALEAVRLEADFAESALLGALNDDRRRVATIVPRVGRTREIAVSGDGRYLALAGGTSLEVFDLTTRLPVGAVLEDAIDAASGMPGAHTFSGEFARLAFSAAGDAALAVRQPDPGRSINELSLIDPDSGARRLSGFGNVIDVVASPSDDMIVTEHPNGLGSFDSRIWLDGELVRTEASFSAGGFSPDGRWLALVDKAGSPRVRIIDTTRLSDPAAGRTIDLARPDSVFVESGPAEWFRGLMSLLGAIPDASGETVLVHWSDAITVVDLAESEDVGPGASAPCDEIRRCVLVGNGVRDVALSQDGLIAMADGVDTVELLDLETGARVGRPFVVGFGEAGPSVEFTPDGRLLTSGTSLTLWTTIEDAAFTSRALSTGDAERVACETAGRNLTLEEWDRFLPADQPYNVTCPQWPEPGDPVDA